MKAEVRSRRGHAGRFHACFPSFVWLFGTLLWKLKIGNNPITSDEYLESALTLKSGEAFHIHSKRNILHSLPSAVPYLSTKLN